MTRAGVLTATIAFTGFLLQGEAMARGPVEDAIASYDSAVADLDGPSEAERASAADAALAGIALDALDAGELRALLDSPISFYTTRWEEFDGVLRARAARPTGEGVTASVLRLDYTAKLSDEAQREAIEAMASHPQIHEALRDGELWARFMNFSWYVRADTIKGLEAQLAALGQHIPERPPMLGVLGAVSLFDALAEADPEGYAHREDLRVATIASLRRLLTYQDPEDPELQRWNFARDIPGTIRDHITRLSGPAVRGTLLDHPAPAIKFIWHSADEHVRSLEDLRGKVVVMDFWATWCGPCIASFPQMRSLVEHYEGMPVAFLGVTSLQGTHYGADGPVDCTDNPEKEFALMKQFIGERDMTWDVVFSEQGVYNPTYGVRGIPHVVILDAEGIVRVRKLHPANHHDRIMDHVDALLRKMGREPAVREGDDG